MPRHNGTEWKTESAWWVKVAGEWKKSTTIWKKVSGVWEKMTLLVAGLVSTLVGTSSPARAAIDSGFLYVTQSSNNRIVKINLTTAEVTTFAGSGVNGDADGVGVLAEFSYPSGISIDSGFAYVCDYNSSKIRKINLTTAEVTTFAGSGVDGDADGVGVLAEFDRPDGITISSGFAYVSEFIGNKIRKINLTTAEVTTFAGSGVNGDADGVGVLAEFDRPAGITISSGSIYVCDDNNEKIRKINLTTAEVTTFAGSGVDGDADGVGVLAEFDRPKDISIYSGFAYICDLGNDKIRRINLTTAEVTTFAGSGVNGDADGVGVLAEFDTPVGIAITSGFAYICDLGNDKIRSISLE